MCLCEYKKEGRTVGFGTQNGLLKEGEKKVPSAGFKTGVAATTKQVGQQGKTKGTQGCNKQEEKSSKLLLLDLFILGGDFFSKKAQVSLSMGHPDWDVDPLVAPPPNNQDAARLLFVKWFENGPS